MIRLVIRTPYRIHRCDITVRHCCRSFVCAAQRTSAESNEPSSAHPSGLPIKQFLRRLYGPTVQPTGWANTFYLSLAVEPAGSKLGVPFPCCPVKWPSQPPCHRHAIANTDKPLAGKLRYVLWAAWQGCPCPELTGCARVSGVCGAVLLSLPLLSPHGSRSAQSSGADCTALGETTRGESLPQRER